MMNGITLKELPRKLRFVCIHWTAGPYTQTDLDYFHYHYTVGADGVVSGGKFQPEDNIPPLANGKYAAHCGGGNSYCIGVSLRGMAGYEGPGKLGKYPLTEKQCEAAWAFIAKLCHEYQIPVTAAYVFTHYEFGKAHPMSDSAGKIDITWLPYGPALKPDEVGAFIRNKINWYLAKLKVKP
jgi:hypothetical protein